jgi:hypothetical protein
MIVIRIFRTFNVASAAMECTDNVETVTVSTVTLSVPIETHFGINTQSLQPNDLSTYKLQSEDVAEDEISAHLQGEEGGEATHQTVTFIDNAVGITIDAPSIANSVAVVDNTNDLSLGNFLSRPTLIDTFSWSTSDLNGVKNTITPWSLFLNDTLIKKKIDNYAFLRARLHVKVLVNGTPFQYGALRTCYSPLLGLVSDKIRTNLVSTQPLLIPYSQQPGFFIQPQANAGGEIILPFFYHKNWLNITSLTDVQQMGTLNYVIYSPLKVAVTGGTSTVTVRTYAWMTDVQLMASTSSLSLQGKDEYGKGIVSAPATAVSAVANMLSKVPIIGPFARATEIGANAVASIATLFGYTNVPVISDVCAYHPMNAPMLASSHIGTPVQKLTLDPKQELSIDPSPHGLGSEDELSMAYLIRKESLFATTSWSTADTAGFQLFNVRINPNLTGNITLNNASAVAVGKRVYDIPLSYVGRLFKHWRGDIIIRIKIVATKFHKGRLKISYDPVADISAIDVSENAVYTQILDIGETDDIEIVIPYHQATAWLRNNQSISDNFTQGNSLAPRAGVDNGLLTIRVLNVLSAPTSGTVDMLFFARGGDNFEYANPNGHIGPDGTNVVPSFFALQGQDTVDLTPTKFIMGNTTMARPERYAQNFGECVGSLRNILHRSTVLETTSIDAVTAASTTTIVKAYKRMPNVPGYQPGTYPLQATKIIAASGNANYCFNTMGHVPYIAGMFMGYRGSVNYHITPSFELQGPLADVRIVRSTNSNSFTQNMRYYTAFTSVLNSASASARANNLNRTNGIDDGLSGIGITAVQTNNTLSFNFPDYNHFNFSLVDPALYANGSTKDGTDEQAAILKILFKSVAATPVDGATIQTEMAAGPDFTALFFLCCPTLDFSTNGPTPV